MIDTVTGLTEVARLVHGQGWPVTFLGGWKTHGRGTLTPPRGAVNHWTAGPRTGDHPSLDIVRYGRPGLRNALANTYSSREPRLYVVAARVAWHAGKGSWRGLRGNSSVLGHEPENSGQGEWSDEHLALIADLDWAQCSVFGYSVEMVCDHFEWTTRKPDRKDVGGPPWRDRVRGLLEGDKPEPEPDPEDDDMKMELWTGPDPERPDDNSDHKWLIQRDMAAPGKHLGYYTKLTPAEAKHYGNLADNPDRGDVIKAEAKAARSWFTDARLARKE